jgi:GT2 family glycosyltransferase
LRGSKRFLKFSFRFTISSTLEKMVFPHTSERTKSDSLLRVSVIVPVYNDHGNLIECLSSFKATPDFSCEIIVVDDASTDDSPLVAAGMEARVLRLPKNVGPAAARNYGAYHAQGEFLFFVDADVVVPPGAVRHVAQIFDEHPDMDAVFGSYDAAPCAQGLMSQYWNLRHHFVHQNSDTEASTFWAGCGAIRRTVFLAVGGFDEKRFRQPSVEDIELGYRLRRAGHRILLDKTLQATHLKQWNLRSVIRTDIFRRAIPWSRLILETKTLPNDLNLKLGQRIGFALVALACALAALAVVQPVLLAGSAVALLGVIVINRSLYGFFVRRRGIAFATASISLHLLYYLYSGLSYSWVWADFQLSRIANAHGAPIRKFIHHRAAEGAEKNK